jgi:hypothetical protein
MVFLLKLTSPESLLVAIIIERQLPIPAFSLGTWPEGLFRLQLQADIQNPRSEGLRFVALLLMTILLGVMQTRSKMQRKIIWRDFSVFASHC